MARQPRRFFRDNDTNIDAYTGPAGEPAFNTTTNRLHMQDGSTPGGHAARLLSDTITSDEVEHTPAASLRDVAVDTALASLAARCINTIDRTTTAPPVSPALGDAYIVPGSPSGDWVGHTNDIAVCSDDSPVAWVFITPVTRQRVWNDEDQAFYTWSGSAWVAVAAGIADDQVTPAKLDAGTTAKQAAMLSRIGIWQAAFNLKGGKVVSSVAANALTFEIKTLAGNDPSAGEPVIAVFRSATIGDATVVEHKITAATSLVITSGSTAGFIANEPSALWVGGALDSGTFRLTASNRSSTTGGAFPLDDGTLESATAEGGAGAADSVGVIYANASFTDKPHVLLARFEWSSGLATIGTWDVDADIKTPFGPGVHKPGDIVQTQVNPTGAVATGTATIPADDTVPGNTEGTLVLTRGLTAKSKANLLLAVWQVFGGSSAVGQVSTALFRNTDASAVCASGAGYRTSGDFLQLGGRHLMRADSIAPQDVKVRCGCNNAHTFTLNGVASTRQFGGVANSILSIMEIQS